MAELFHKFLKFGLGLFPSLPIDLLSSRLLWLRLLLLLGFLSVLTRVGGRAESTRADHGTASIAAECLARVSNRLLSLLDLARFFFSFALNTLFLLQDATLILSLFLTLCLEF